MNGLKPAVIQLDNIYADVDSHSVTVIVDEDQQSLAIGKKGQNVRLASRLCGWDIDIKTREEFEAEGFGSSEEASPGEEHGTGDDAGAGEIPAEGGESAAAEDTGPGPRTGDEQASHTQPLETDA
jgi:N utilization substance protein A